MIINCAVVGTGIGLKHIEAIDFYKNFRVKSICEFDKKKIKFLKRKFPKKVFFDNFDDIVKDKTINLISIASYDEFHYDQVIHSIKKKCHIIVEKPICLTLQQLKKIQRELKLNPKIHFTSNLVLRKNDLFKNIRNKINIKDVYHIEASYLWGRKEKLFQWRSKTKNYSLTLGATIHILDLICWFLNSKPISVFTKVDNKITKDTKFKKFSFATYIFTFPGNIIVNLKADAVCIHPHYHSLKIFEKNQTFISDLFSQFIIKKKTGQDNFKIINTKYKYPDKKNRGKFIREFLDSIIDNKFLYPSKKDIFNLMTACFYADLSARHGKEINIKYFND